MPLAARNVCIHIRLRPFIPLAQLAQLCRLSAKPNAATHFALCTRARDRSGPPPRAVAAAAAAAGVAGAAAASAIVCTCSANS